MWVNQRYSHIEQASCGPYILVMKRERPVGMTTSSHPLAMCSPAHSNTNLRFNPVLVARIRSKSKQIEAALVVNVKV